MLDAHAVIRATLWDFGGVIMTGPFEAFSQYEQATACPTASSAASTPPTPTPTRGPASSGAPIGRDEFCRRFEAEAQAAGGIVDAGAIVDLLAW